MQNQKMIVLILGAVVSLALISAGCSPAPSSFPPGTYFTQIVDADIPAGFPLDVVDIRGEWEFEFTQAGRIHVRHRGEEVASGVYSSDAETLELGEDEGPLACTPLDLGNGQYRWSQDGDAITLVLISDLCDGRAIVSTAHPLESR